MAEATCRIFLKPMVFKYLKDIAVSWADIDPLPITYIDQVIPSPYEMPAFESLPENWQTSLMRNTLHLKNQLI